MGTMLSEREGSSKRGDACLAGGEGHKGGADATSTWVEDDCKVFKVFKVSVCLSVRTYLHRAATCADGRLSGDVNVSVRHLRQQGGGAGGELGGTNNGTASLHCGRVNPSGEVNPSQ